MIIACRLWIFALCVSTISAHHVSLIYERKDSWISKIDFATMLNASFPFARCCNVFMNGSTLDVEQSFEYFVEVYPHDYLVMQRTYNCQGYLLIASDERRLLWALERVPSAISTTELLIIFNDHLPEDSQLFNGSLYRNSNANLVSVSGIWSLSENFLEPRIFEKVKRYEDLRYQNGLADFKGRVLQVAAYYNPPVCYLNRTVNKTVKGIEAEVFLADNDIEKDGFEFNIFTLIAERLNFSWSARAPSGGFRYGRRIDTDKWKGGMIGQLVNKEIDIAFSGLWLKEDHNIFTNLSVPFGQLLIRYLVPRPRPYTSFWALTRPFTPFVWVIILLILVCQTCYMTIRSRLKLENRTRRFRSFSYTGMELTGRLLGIWVPKKILGVRVQLQFWQIAGLVLVTAYCSSLAARLAGAEYEDRIDTVSQFLRAGLTWGREGPVPIFSDYFDLQDKYSAMLPDRFEHENSSEDRRRKIAKGNYAIVGRVIGGVFFPEDDVSNHDLHSYRLMSETVGAYYSCFAMQPWLLEKINKMMLYIIETGFTAFHLKDVIRRRAGYSLREVLEERDRNDGTPTVLALTPLASGFVLLVSGLTVSSVVFCLEIKRGSRSEKCPAYRDSIVKSGNVNGAVKKNSTTGGSTIRRICRKRCF